MMRNRPHIIPASQVDSEMAPDFSSPTYRMLAQGDSWFSINGLNLLRASSLLPHLDFGHSTIIVNCADPGDTLAHMVNWRRDPWFASYLCGPRERTWDAMLLSAGGNDLIDALGVAPADAHGTPHSPGDRLLLTKAERGIGANGYISEDGWTLFEQHLRAQFVALDAMRASSKTNQNMPVVTHTYDYATPRDVGAGLCFGPWLYPALVAYEVPPADWQTLANEFLDRLFDLVNGLPLQNFHVIRTLGTLRPANANPSVDSADWLNEIHPTSAGYEKIAERFCADFAAKKILP
ncbi:hypothetical protein [Paraburkholderia kururiensis]|uniref:hypothetical protein n=1 Tax=Paraburkholderia kururiensis TaxID=984307 RepID=UPI000382BC31|nr:hypothetical protein [Paraburkholderia kururiensis]